MTIGRVFSPSAPPPHPVVPVAEKALAAGILTPQHVARLGGELFGRHLIAVEVAGVLLLVALVGAAVIVAAKEIGLTAMPNEIAILDNYLIVGALLFGIGMIGFLSRRNMIVMFLSAEIMLQGVSLSLVAWGRFHNDFGGQMLVIVHHCRGGLRGGPGVGDRSWRCSPAAARSTSPTGNVLREANQPPFQEEPLLGSAGRVERAAATFAAGRRGTGDSQGRDLRHIGRGI